MTNTTAAHKHTNSGNTHAHMHTAISQRRACACKQAKQACAIRRAWRSATRVRCRRMRRDTMRCDAHIDRVDNGWTDGCALCRHVCTRTYAADGMAHLGCMAAVHVRRPPAHRRPLPFHNHAFDWHATAAALLSTHRYRCEQHTSTQSHSQHNHSPAHISTAPRRRTAVPVPPRRSTSPFPWTAAVGVNMVRGVIRDIDLP